jgi:acyl dehydratase
MMTRTIRYASVHVGDPIPTLTTPPISRTTLALYAGASGDHNPMHIDIDFARKAGVPDVFAHGMLSMAYLARALTGWVPQAQIRSYNVRFSSITQVGDAVTCTGRIVEKFEQDGETRVKLALTAANQAGAVTLQGEAVVALP